jgi:hypothetical protein
MSIYSSEQVKSHILDPVYNKSMQRAEFRLPADTTILSNMRLGNIGGLVPSTRVYNSLSGALGIIESIHLYDGNVLLDQLLEAPIYNAFQNYNNNNQQQKDMVPNVHKARIGRYYGGIATDGNINSGDLTTPGTNYGDGTFANVTLGDGSGGASARATVTVAGGIVTAVTITDGGAGYLVSDELTIPALGGGTGDDARFTVESVKSVGPKINNYNLSSNGMTEDENTTGKALFYVSDMLPILKNMLMINTSTFKNLKLVVNFSNNLSNWSENVTLPIVGQPNFGSVQPFLLFDEMVGQNVPNANFDFFSVEHDRFVVDAVGTSVLSATNQVSRQQITNKLSGFDNKSVKRMLLVKTPQLKTTYQTAVNINTMYGPLGSKAFFNESLQVRLNGANLYAGAGINKENQRLAMLTDTFGNSGAYPFGNGSAQVNDNVTDASRGLNINLGNSVISELDYYGINLNATVSDLQIEFGRDCLFVVDNTGGAGVGSNAATNAASINQQIFINAFAEVKKSIIFQPDGSYLVVYA